MHIRLIHHGEVDSTSERAFAEIAAGEARHGDVHIAVSQTAGRGRLGRRWSSPPGEGLYLSLVLLPAPPPWSAAALTIAAGLSVFESASRLGVARARLKWPNDLVVGPMTEDAKLAGVLVETRGFDPEKPHYVVGIGFNVRQTSFPAELLAERPVASLATLGLDVSLERTREEVLDALQRAVARIPMGDDRLAEDFLCATGLAGKNVRVRIGDVEHEGVLEGISAIEGVRIRGRDASARSFPLEIVRRLSPSL